MSRSIPIPGAGILLIKKRDYNLCLDSCDYCGSNLKKPGQSYCNETCRKARLCLNCQRKPKTQANSPFCSTYCAVNSAYTGN